MEKRQAIIYEGHGSTITAVDKHHRLAALRACSQSAPFKCPRSAAASVLPDRGHYFIKFPD